MQTSIITACACGTKSRIPAGNVADHAVCGVCKRSLPPVAVPVEVEGSSFDQILGRAKVPVFVDFGARWCWPSRMSGPEVEDLAEKVQGRALVLKVNTETQQELAKRYGVETIPHFVVFQNSEPILQRTGAARSFEMLRWIEQAAELAPLSRGAGAG